MNSDQIRSRAHAGTRIATQIRPGTRPRAATRVVAALAFAALCVASSAASAVVLPVVGVLHNNSGGVVSDGVYPLTFRIYDAVDAEKPLYNEVQVGVQVSGGRFQTALGAEAPEGQELEPAFFAAHPSLWLGVKVSIDPELPRVAFGAVPFAVYASLAGDLAGGIGASKVAFTYAGSNEKGGAALGLECTGCVTKAHLAADVLTAVNVAYQQGAKPTTVQAALGAIDGALKIDGSSVGVGKAPAEACALDVGSDSGVVCVDGKPSVLLRFAAGQVEMDKLQKTGQLVYRTDQDEAWMFRKGKWRKLVFSPVCGDGELELGEQCDDGPDNADLPDKCRTTCIKPDCGDAIIDAGEQCDDGNLTTTDACVACKVAVCGDSYVHLGAEDCDDGNGVTTDGCIECKKATCGDGYIEAGVEVCDIDKLGGQTCKSVKGQEWDGSLGCAVGCKAFDLTGCHENTFVGTKILSAAAQAQLGGWFGNAAQKWTLCYQRSTHAGDASTFHTKCNGKGPTISVMKTTTGKIFGGFTNIAWSDSQGYKNEAASWLFSIDGNSKHTAKPANYQHAVYHRADYGPTFGGGHDINVKNDLNSGYTNFGHSYNCPWGSGGQCQTYFAGNYDSWNLSELEVFVKL
mgnify:CR=1 FL=1